MQLVWLMVIYQTVALLTESVDWNLIVKILLFILVRRSPHGERGLKWYKLEQKYQEQQVALLTESVDWNTILGGGEYPIESLSSRRAWIEIRARKHLHRNDLSLSSRRAWIEILTSYVETSYNAVALLTESVDWNPKSETVNGNEAGRSPHGERGLKSCKVDLQINLKGSLSSRRAWIEIGTTPSTWLNSMRRSPHGERGLK